MPLVLVTPPASSPVSLQEAKRHLRIEAPDDDANLEIYIAAAVANADGRDGHLGRALSEQTWELRLDEFCPEIKIPLPPLKNILSVKYIDTGGTLQTVDPAAYRVTGGGFGPSVLSPVYLTIWPLARCDRESVRIQFTCGYGAAGVEALPAAIKAALLLVIGGLFENREILSVEQLYEMPAVKALLLPYRASWF